HTDLPVPGLLGLRRSRILPHEIETTADVVGLALVTGGKCRESHDIGSEMMLDTRPIGFVGLRVIPGEVPVVGAVAESVVDVVVAHTRATDEGRILNHFIFYLPECGI